MAFKDILVIVNNARSTGARMDVAVGLARRHDARLTGLFVRSSPPVPRFIESRYGAQLKEVYDRSVAEAAAEGKALFHDKTAGLGLAAEWIETSGSLLQEAGRHAKCADLVVVGQFDPATDTAEGEARLLDHLVVDTGRAVLAVPFEPTVATVGQTVMVAWNGSREAARAVSDALPLLTLAQDVIVTVVEPTEHGGEGAVSVEAITAHLVRHGVPARPRTLQRGHAGVGDVLQAEIVRQGADMLVMGAWGHTHLRELVLGGASRHILKHMIVPTVMSH